MTLRERLAVTEDALAPTAVLPEVLNHAYQDLKKSIEGVWGTGPLDLSNVEDWVNSEPVRKLLNTVLLAIMSAALRVAKSPASASAGA